MPGEESREVVGAADALVDAGEATLAVALGVGELLQNECWVSRVRRGCWRAGEGGEEETEMASPKCEGIGRRQLLSAPRGVRHAMVVPESGAQR